GLREAGERGESGYLLRGVWYLTIPSNSLRIRFRYGNFIATSDTQRTSGLSMSSGIEAQVLQPYKYGFVTDIEAEVVPPGLNEDIIRLISEKKGEPEWMLEWRLKAYRNWVKMPEPHWPNVKYGPIDYPAISC